MATAEQLNHAKAFLRKAEEYLASAEDNLVAERHTAAAGDAIHAGISAKDAIVTALTGATRKAKDYAAVAAICAHDTAAYAGTCPRIRCSRTGTLGARADRCDFCLEIIAPTPAQETREAA